MRNRSLPLTFLLGSVQVACAFEANEQAVVGETDLAVLTTKSLETTAPTEHTISCGDNGYATDVDTQFTLTLTEDDMVWISGYSLVEYSSYGNFVNSGPYDRFTHENVQTRLTCQYDGVTPPTTYVIGRSAQNLWAIDENNNGVADAGSNISSTHNVRAIFTAPTSGQYTCWMTYVCLSTGSNTPGQVTFLAGSTLKYYSANQFPGESWNQAIAENCYDGTNDGDDPNAVGCEVVTTTGHTVQSETWYAGQLSSDDSEVVAMWSPQVTSCLPGDDDGAGLDRCDNTVDHQNGGDGLEDMISNATDTRFRWRLGVYQRVSGVTCNKAFGAWSNEVPCRYGDHHCDADIHTAVFPIITFPAVGSEGISCGNSLSDRNFKVFAQIRKVDGQDNDLVVEDGAYSNLMIYSRN